MPSSPSPADPSYTVYLLLCSDGSVYVGQTDHLARRLRQHQAGRAAKHTRERLPVRLIHAEPYPDLTHARQREQQLKRWSRAKKLALADGHLAIRPSAPDPATPLPINGSGDSR